MTNVAIFVDAGFRRFDYLKVSRFDLGDDGVEAIPGVLDEFRAIREPHQGIPRGCIPKLWMRRPCKNRRQALLAELASSLQLIGRGVQRQSVRASVRDNALMLDWQSSQRWLIT